MANRPDVQRIKKQKRDQAVEPAAGGMSRRRFLTYLGTGSAALAAGSAGVLTGCAEGQGQNGSGSEENGSADGGASQATSGGERPFFTPIEASDDDELRLTEGFKYDIVRRSADPMGGGMIFGDHADYLAYFPIDSL